LQSSLPSIRLLALEVIHQLLLQLPSTISIWFREAEYSSNSNNNTSRNKVSTNNSSGSTRNGRFGTIGDSQSNTSSSNNIKNRINSNSNSSSYVGHRSSSTGRLGDSSTMSTVRSTSVLGESLLTIYMVVDIMLYIDNHYFWYQYYYNYYNSIIACIILISFDRKCHIGFSFEVIKSSCYHDDYRNRW